MSLLQNSKEAVELKLMLNMMSRIEGNPEVTQRTLSAELGIAIGLVNSYLKRCIQKGWVKVQQIPTRRFAYYLTPTGFVEKTKLTVKYLTCSFEFIRNARAQYSTLFNFCEQNAWQRILIVGIGELADIANQVANKNFLQLTFCPLPITASNLQDIETNFDAMVITDSESPQATFELLLAHFPEEKILVPEFLHISRINRLSVMMGEHV